MRDARVQRDGRETVPGRAGRYRGPVLALVLVAFSLGLSNFAAAIGIGVAGAHAGTRVRVGVVFGIYEVGTPILGLALGHGLASTLGHAARWAGAGLLVLGGDAGGEDLMLTA